jgi:hypothetical protein
VNRYARKRDANHGTLIATFLQLGCTVIDTSHAGIPGWPDVVVGCMGQNHLVEFKNPGSRYGRAGLNANQQAFARDWRGGQVFVVSTTDEVIALVSNWRRTDM